MRLPLVLPSLALFAAPLAAQGDVTDFEGGANAPGWSFNVTVPDSIETTGGNPGFWLRNAGIISFAPILTNDSATAGPWVGDYRAARVNCISLDARTDFASLTAAGRELSLLLRDTKGTATVNDDDYAYFVGALIPQVGAGWVHYDFDVPSQSVAAVPPGWTGGWVGDLENFRPGIEWSDVITSVDRVELWWLNPSFVALIQDWDVGVDNLALKVTSDWGDLGFGLPGINGLPELTVSGVVAAGELADIQLVNARPNTPAFLVAGLAAQFAPFKGGTLVPVPQKVVSRTLSGAGTDSILATLPPAVTSGSTVYLQYWIKDAAGPVGWAASNCVSGSAP